MADDCANGDALGRLKVLSVEEMRQIWPREAQDLAPWIKSNIEQLNDTLGLQIEVEHAESPVDNFRLDLAGTDAVTQKPVVIELQFGQSDHDHLGKLITYAADQEAGILIWIANELRPAHRNALEWLNNISSEDLLFYGVNLQAFRIDDSRPAARFDVQAGPPVAKRPPSGAPTPLQLKYQAFWDRFLQHMHSSHPGVIKAKKAPAASWFFAGGGRSGFSLGASFTIDSAFRIELYIDAGNKQKNEVAFDTLSESKADIEQELGTSLQWDRLPDKRACRISTARDAAIEDPADKLSELETWGGEWMAKFRRAFEPRITKLDLSAPA